MRQELYIHLMIYLMIWSYGLDGKNEDNVYRERQICDVEMKR